jgi:predicted outer membrane repeat protein
MFFKLRLTSRRIVASGIALLFSAGPLFAATITVTSSEDAAGGSCPGASCTLRQAIATAAPGDTIVFNLPTFAVGHNAATQVFSISLGSELAISKNLTIDGGANKIVLIRPGALPQFRILNVTSGTVTIARLTITGGSLNSGAASDVGAGVQNAGNLTLSACTISSNNAGNGGGGVFNSGTIVLRNCTVANNTTGNSGGGSGVKNVGNATLTSCTIVGNNQVGGSNVGAGVFNSGTTHVGNTVIAKNATGAGGADDVAGNFLSDGYNFIGTADASTGFGTAGSHDQTGTKAALIDPGLSALRDNGGPTKTMGPFSNSPLVNQGNSGGLTTDQRGDPRPIGQASVAGGDGSDIGAVERGPQQFPNSGTNLTVTNTDEHNDHECRVDDCTLAAAIEAGNFIAANAAMGAVTIKFAPGLGGVILNTAAPTGLGIVAALNIVGPGARVLTISGNNVARVFNVAGGTGNIVNISGLTIANAHINDSGGGISNVANLTLRDCAVLNNSGGSGGGAVNAATMHVTNCTFAGNQSTGNGGALRNVGDLVVTNSSFNNNTAVSSGAIASFVASGPAATLNVVNCTISGNTASDPSAGTGGGIFNGNLSTATVSNTIVANNTAATGTDVSGAFTSGGHNLIRITTGSTGFINGNNGDQVGIPAGLDTLKNNGGPTDTMALLSSSTAINNGGANAPSADQRGYSRFGVSDIGAFEFNGIAPTLANISTRLPVGSGDNVLIAGFIVTGTQPKKVIIRALGPSVPVSGALANPVLELYSGSTILESNDDWMGSPNKQAIIDSTIPPSSPLESAIVRSVAPGNYTAIERGVNNGTGIGVIEVYDLDTSANSKLANISTRGLVQTGDNVLFAGMIVVGQASQNVIIRALGPSTGVPGAMADPTLELRDANGNLLEANDNWMDSPNKQAIIDSTIPPTNDLESAIVRTLTPANYTAIVRGAGGTTGIAVVEVYALN